MDSQIVLSLDRVLITDRDEHGVQVPFFTRDSGTALFGFEETCHWHPDVEFFYVYSGELDMFINGNDVHINTGEGVFVNSQRLHYNYPKNDDNSGHYFLMMNIAEMMKDAVIISCLQKLTDKDVADYLVLHPDVPWEAEVLQSIKTIHETMQPDDFNALRVFAMGCDICATIAEHISDLDNEYSYDREYSIFLNMTNYIHEHYHEPINLDSIAAAGGICRSKCCQIFQDQVKQTPNNYLVQYRIAKSCELLRNTDMSVRDISSGCGFNSPSYFTNVFQKNMGKTPRQYRAIHG